MAHVRRLDRRPGEPLRNWGEAAPLVREALALIVGAEGGVGRVSRPLQARRPRRDRGVLARRRESCALSASDLERALGAPRIDAIAHRLGIALPGRVQRWLRIAEARRPPDAARRHPSRFPPRSRSCSAPPPATPSTGAAIPIRRRSSGSARPPSRRAGSGRSSARRGRRPRLGGLADPLPAQSPACGLAGRARRHAGLESRSRADRSSVLRRRRRRRRSRRFGRRRRRRRPGRDFRRSQGDVRRRRGQGRRLGRCEPPRRRLARQARSRAPGAEGPGRQSRLRRGLGQRRRPDRRRRPRKVSQPPSSPRSATASPSGRWRTPSPARKRAPTRRRLRPLRACRRASAQTTYSRSSTRRQ